MGTKGVIELNADNQVLELVIANDLEWCRVFLKNGQAVELGADTLKPIVERLLNFLKSDDLPDESNPEKNVALMLYEKHTMGFASKTTTGRKIVLRNGVTSEFIGSITLNTSEVQAWIRKLEVNDVK